jgi:hypothetical protein
VCENDRRSGALWEGSGVCCGVRCMVIPSRNFRPSGHFLASARSGQVDETRRASDAEEDD